MKRIAVIALSLSPGLLVSPGLAASAPDWQEIDAHPDAARWSQTMVYDSQRGLTVMFGGRDSDPRSDTLEYDGSTWTTVATDHSPPARFWHAMAYDADRHRVVLFGGGDPGGGVHYGDTWEYDGVDWSQVVTVHSPSPRLTRTMVFDQSRHRVVLFGGDGDSTVLTDTWEYDGTDWTQVTPATSPPGAGALAAMAYDAHRARTVLTFNNGGDFVETWEYDGADWHQVFTANSPLTRWAHGMAFDVDRVAILLFGGYAPNVGAGSTMNDSWEYDGTDWVRIDTPHLAPADEQFGMTYDSRRRRVVVNVWGATWEYGNLIKRLLDNGPGNGSCCSEMSGWTLAEDFEMEEAETLTTVQFQLEDGTWTFPDNWDGSVQYWIYYDNAGSPGAFMTSGSAANLAPEHISDNVYTVGLDLGFAIPLLAHQRLWIALHMTADWNEEHQLFWSLADSGFGEMGWVDDGTGTSWGSSGHHLVFQLYGELREIYSDGFESGDCYRWTAEVP